MDGGNIELTGYNQCYFKRARRAASVLKLIPTVLLVGVSGSISRNEAIKTSDIDFFVVSRKGRIFTTRFFCKLLMLILGIARKNGDDNPAGKICLNYFLSEEALDFRPHGSGTIRHHRTSIILYAKADILKKLIKANHWLKPKFQTKFCQHKHAEEQISHRHFDESSRRNPNTNTEISQSPPAGGLLRNDKAKTGSQIKFGMTRRSALLFDIVETLLKNYQIRKIKSDPLTASHPKKIIFQDQELRFHPPKG